MSAGSPLTRSRAARTAWPRLRTSTTGSGGSPPARLLSWNPLTLGAVDDVAAAARAGDAASDLLAPAGELAVIARGLDGRPPLIVAGGVNTDRVPDLAQPLQGVHAALSSTSTALAEVSGSGPVGTVHRQPRQLRGGHHRRPRPHQRRGPARAARPSRGTGGDHPEALPDLRTERRRDLRIGWCSALGGDGPGRQGHDLGPDLRTAGVQALPQQPLDRRGSTQVGAPVVRARTSATRS